MLFPLRSVLAVVITALMAFGCSSAGGQLGTLQTQNRSLLEQNRVQLAEIENLKTHARRLEDRLVAAEQDLASLERQGQPARERLAARENERSLFDSPQSERSATGGKVKGDEEREN